MSRKKSKPIRQSLINRIMQASGDALGLPDLKLLEEKWEDDFMIEFERALKNKKDGSQPKKSPHFLI